MSDAVPIPDAICDGGDMGCGGGLLTMIVLAMKQLRPGQILEIQSTDLGVREDLPAWCRMAGHTLLASQLGQARNRYLVLKGA